MNLMNFKHIVNGHVPNFWHNPDQDIINVFPQLLLIGIERDFIENCKLVHDRIKELEVKIKDFEKSHFSG